MTFKKELDISLVEEMSVAHISYPDQKTMQSFIENIAEIIDIGGRNIYTLLASILLVIVFLYSQTKDGKEKILLYVLLSLITIVILVIISLSSLEGSFSGNPSVPLGGIEESPEEPSSDNPPPSSVAYSLQLESLVCQPEVRIIDNPVTISKELINPKTFIQVSKNGAGLSCQIPEDDLSDFSNLSLELGLSDDLQQTVDVSIYVGQEKVQQSTLETGKGSQIFDINIQNASTFRLEFQKTSTRFIAANVYFLKAEVT